VVPGTGTANLHEFFHINAYDSNDNCLPALALLLNFACLMGVLGDDSLSGECFLLSFYLLPFGCGIGTAFAFWRLW
jgi:hypothetical protein